MAVQLVMNCNAAVLVVEKDCGGDGKASVDVLLETSRN